MLRITALFLLLFSVLLVLFWSRSYTESPSVAFLYQYDLKTGQASAQPPAFGGAAPFNLVRADSGIPSRVALPRNSTRMQDDAGKETANDLKSDADGGDGPAYLGPGVPGQVLESKLRYYAAFQGRGYFQYAKIGRELSFHSRRGEELWRKPYKAYPVSDARGELVLLLTGDNNRVDVIDQSGNPTGVRSVAGNFMTDLDFAVRRSAAAIVFSTGALRVLNESGELVLDYQSAASGGAGEALFVKSCAIGPDARHVALHLLAGDRDLLIVLGFDPDDGKPAEYELLRTIDLAEVYPHLLHFALNRHGVLLVAPERTEYFALETGSDYTIDGSNEASSGGARSVYRPVFADRDYFVYGSAGDAVVLSANGRQIMRLRRGQPATGAVVAAPRAPLFRIVPGPQPGQFALHGPERVQLFAYQSR